MALILDTGVIVAALDRGDPAHADCRALVETSHESRIIPSPVLAEVDYLLSRSVGAGPMVAFLGDILAGAFVVEDLTEADYRRVAEIVDRYEDVGFVDAAVLAVTERLGEPKLATLDRRHFAMLRPQHVDALQLLPG